MQKHHPQFTMVIVPAFYSGHPQTMHHFELKKNHTIVFVKNEKWSHSLYVVQYVYIYKYNV